MSALRVILFVFVFVLAGCGQQERPFVTADLSYSNAGGFGTQNAGDYRPGSVFIWNTRTNGMQFVDTIELERVASEILSGSRSSNRIAGIGITGLPASLSGQEGLVSASLAAQSNFSVTGGFREDYRKVRTALSEYVTEMLSDGDEPDLLFKPRDDEFRVVVIRSVLRAHESRLSIGGTDATDPTTIASISLNSPIGEISSVNIRAGTNTTCSAPENTAENERPVCFFNVVVYKPTYLQDNPRLQWENADFPADRLPAAFRNVR